MSKQRNMEPEKGMIKGELLSFAAFKSIKKQIFKG